MSRTCYQVNSDRVLYKFSTHKMNISGIHFYCFIILSILSLILTNYLATCMGVCNCFLLVPVCCIMSDLSPDLLRHAILWRSMVCDAYICCE